jgi:heterodisulfide reductase subunit A
VSGSILVLGGGLTGLQAAVELAAADVQAIVVERGPIIGGKRAAALTGTGSDQLDPRLASVADEPTITCLTMAELESLSGEDGNFIARVRQLPRYVTEDCTRCNHCAPVCPQAVPNEYDAGLTYRKAIHNPFPRTIPNIYAIDIDSCLNMPPNYLPCQRCVEVCDDKAIHFDITPPDTRELALAAVIVATGYVDDSEDEQSSLAEFGYGQSPDVVSSVELQRMLEDPGPSGGFAIRPSDEGYPDSVLLVLTRVSASAAWVMSNQLRRLAAQGVEQVNVLVLAAKGDDPVLEPLHQAAAAAGIAVDYGLWIGTESADDGKLLARYARLPGGADVREQVDLLVLSSEVHPHPEAAVLAEKLGLDRDPQGYLQASRPGIYLAGGVLGTVGIQAGAEQASAVVRAALQHLKELEPPAGEDTAASGPELQRLEQMLHALIRLGDRT